MSVQRQVLFRSQHLHDILGLLAYNPSENGGGGGISGQKQKQVTTKKPEPHVVNHTGIIGSKTGQIHLDGVKEGGNEEEEKSVDDGEGRGVRDTSRASDVGSFCSTSNEGETRLLPIPIHVHSYPVYQ